MEYIEKYGWAIILAFIFFGFYKPIICFLIIGTIGMFYGIHYLLFLISIKRIGKETMGRILSYEIEDEGYKTPRIEFEIEGKQISKKPYYYSSTDLSKFRTYKSNINENVPIIYNPRDPEKFIMKTEEGFNYFSLAFAIIIGLIFMFLSFAQLFHFISIDGMS